jgi:hypothetical protein
VTTILFGKCRGGSGSQAFGLCFEAYVPAEADLVIIELTPNDSVMGVGDKLLRGWQPDPLWPNHLETGNRWGMNINVIITAIHLFNTLPI